jgi:signal peptidase I
MVIWAAVAAVVTLAWVLSVWLLLLCFAVRIAAAIEAGRRVRAADRARTPSDWIGALVAIGLNVALVIGIRFFAIENFRLPSTSMAPTIIIGDHVLADKLSLRWRPPARGDLIIFRQPCQPDRDYLKRVIAVAGETVEIRCDTVYVAGAPLAGKLVQGEGCQYDDQHEGSSEWYSTNCSEYTETAGSHTYHVYHDAERPERDAHQGTRSANASKDFPRLDRLEQPPSCASASDGPSPPASNQLPGSIVETKANALPCELQRHYVVPPCHVFVLGDNRPNSNDSRYWGSVPLENVTGRVKGIWLSQGRAGNSLRRFGAID